MVRKLRIFFCVYCVGINVSTCRKKVSQLGPRILDGSSWEVSQTPLGNGNISPHITNSVRLLAAFFSSQI